MPARRSTRSSLRAVYAASLPVFLAAGVEGGKLPFLYESTGVETLFRDQRGPEPRSRRFPVRATMTLCTTNGEVTKPQ